MFPEVYIRFWQSIILATLMSMPETTVDKHNCLVSLKHYVGRTGQFSIVDTIAQSSGEKILPNNHLRFGILSLYSRHATASLRWCHNIRHCDITFVNQEGLRYSYSDGNIRIDRDKLLYKLLTAHWRYDERGSAFKDISICKGYCQAIG